MHLNLTSQNSKFQPRLACTIYDVIRTITEYLLLVLTARCVFGIIVLSRNSERSTIQMRINRFVLRHCLSKQMVRSCLQGQNKAVSTVGMEKHLEAGTFCLLFIRHQKRVV
jgi:hypothetical protein